MLTATFELEQEDVNPDDYSEPKTSPSTLLGHLQPLASDSTDPERPRSAVKRKSLFTLPLSGNRQKQQQPSESKSIRIKRQYQDKENSSVIGEELRDREETYPSTIRKRSLLELVEEDIQKRLNKSKEKTRKRKTSSLSLVAAGQPKEKKSKEQEPPKPPQADIVEVTVEDRIECTPPLFEDVPEVVKRQDSCSSLSGKSRQSSQQIDWGQIEAISVESLAEEGRESEKSVFDFTSLFAEKQFKPPPKTYPACSSSRLTLSKNFLQQQKQQQKLNGQQTSLVAEIEPPRDRLVGGGEDDMSIHPQQHYNLPSSYNSVSNTANTNYQQEVAPASSILRLAAATGEPQTMSNHSHFTRNKLNSMQGRFSQSTATDMAITASLNDISRSKVNSLQGRVDTGTATELAIAQSLSEDQQNILNAVTPLIGSLTPANIAAAANMNNSLATLCNIGNSCYLNSVLYTLRFAPNFIHNLHHLIEDTDSVYQRLNQNKLKSSSLGRNISGLHGPSGRSWSSKDLASLGGSTTTTSSTSSAGSGPTTTIVNGTNAAGNGGGGSGGLPATREENLPPKTNRQVVTEQLHELFQNLHRNEAIESMEPFHAGNILRAVQDVSSTFEGNQQQDAHEFLMCVLDSVRESCQSLIKTITDHPDVLISACPPVPECIEPFTPEPKSGAARFFRRRKESVKTTKPTSNGGSGGVSSGATTLPKAAVSGGSGDASDPLVNLKNALFAKTSSAADEQLVRERLRALGLDFFRDDFEGVTVAKTKCLACETCTEQKETMIDIAIPIASSEVCDAGKNPQLFYQNSCITREYFRGDNKYRCEECCGYREAIRSISFEVLPRQLILQLKRFNGDMEKINSYIPTPFVLRCFCNTCLPKPDCDKPHIYRLYSVITHVGARMSVGHYIAYTSSLDVHAEYLGCGKDRRRQLFLSGGSLDGLAGSAGSGSAKNNSEKGTSGPLKKLFSAKKAFSAGDMSKKTKNIVVNKMNLINGMEGLNLINGTSAGSSNTSSFGSQSGSNSPNSNGTPTGSGGSLTSRIPCAGLNCCGIHLKNSHLSLYGNGSCDTSSAADTNGIPLGASESINGSTNPVESRMNYINSMANGFSSSAVGSGAPTNMATFEQSLSQQLWHMCDDDKIKIMSQVEFEELLSPNRRHVITPYLLFYARYDLAPAGSGRQKDSETGPLKAGGHDGGGIDSGQIID